MAGWIGIDSSHLDSACHSGEFDRLLTEALNGTDYWRHVQNHTHWFIIDLGQNYDIQQIRGRSLQIFDPIDVNIYVSEDKVDWGVAVATGISTWQDRNDWAGNAVINVTDKVGRYIRIEIVDTEGGSRELYWGTNPSSPIIDIYVDDASFPPTPDPMTFSSSPAYVNDTSITMTASLATHDTEDVEYYFTNTAGGGNDSSWQDSRTYVDEGLEPDTEYTYTVTARTKTSQDETAASSGASAYTFPATPVDPSELVVASTSNSVLDLTWSDNSDSYQETGTKVERSADGESGWSVIETGPADDEAYQDTSLDSNTQYFYRVRVFIDGNAGTAYSNYTSVANNYTRPDNPTSLVLTVVDYQQIDLDWSGEGSYKVERSETGDFSGEEVEIVSESDALSASAYSDTGLTKDTAYYYRVRAFNDGGDSAGYTSEVSALTPPESPADPSGLTATSVSNSRIDLSWADNSSSPNEDGFEIYRSTTSAVAGFTLLDTNAANDTTYSDTSLDSNTQYWYKIRGYIDSLIDSDTTAYSNYTAVANNWTRPDTATDLTLGTPVSSTILDLQWLPAGIAYRIERSLTGSFSGEEVEVVSESDDLTVVSYTDEDLDSNILYYYRVMVYNDGGDAASWSSIASERTLLNISVEPFTTTKDSIEGWDTINLTWVDPTEASDDEYYFIIQRMLDGAGDETDPNNTAWVTLVDESDSYDSITYEDTDVDSNTTYHYQVRVYSPDDSNYSLWASDSATTDPVPEIPIADAGEDQTVSYAARASISLDGSGSTSDAEIISYVWRSKGLTIATGVNPVIELAEGEHKITLSVSNVTGTGYDNVTVTIGLQPIAISNLIPEKFR